MLLLEYVPHLSLKLFSSFLFSNIIKIIKKLISFANAVVFLKNVSQNGKKWFCRRICEFDRFIRYLIYAKHLHVQVSCQIIDAHQGYNWPKNLITLPILCLRTDQFLLAQFLVCFRTAHSCVHDRSAPIHFYFRKFFVKYRSRRISVKTLANTLHIYIVGGIYLKLYEGILLAVA